MGLILGTKFFQGGKNVTPQLLSVFWRKLEGKIGNLLKIFLGQIGN